MKIRIGTVKIPFVRGGAEALADELKTALQLAGHETEIVTMSFHDNPSYYIEDHIIAARLMDQEWSWGGRTDLFIGLKFPAYYMPHPNKVIWILHQHRQAYDLFNTELSDLKNNYEGNKIRRIVYNADCRYINEAKRVYTISGNVTKRLNRYNNISSKVLYPPSPDMEKFYCDAYDEYILMPSRINATKRQILALESLCKSKSNISLYIIGKGDNGYEEKQMLDFIKSKDLIKRVKYMSYVSQEEKIRLYSNAKAVLFIPKDEDLGFITMDGMAAGKAIITAKDSGGPLEFVRDGKTGIIAEPTPDSIAEAIDRMADDTNFAIRCGENGKIRLTAMNITWENVVRELTKP